MKTTVQIWKLMASSEVLTSENEVKGEESQEGVVKFQGAIAGSGRSLFAWTPVGQTKREAGVEHLGAQVT